MEWVVDDEPDLANPDFLPNGFAGITLKNHTVMSFMQMDSDWLLWYG